MDNTSTDWRALCAELADELQELKPLVQQALEGPEMTITPPRELVRPWIDQDEGGPDVIHRIAARAAQWGADQELEACIAFVRRGPWCSEKLRAARRPKPLVQQALEQPEPSLTVENCSNMHKHRFNYLDEDLPEEITLDGCFTREDLIEIANTVPTTEA